MLNSRHATKLVSLVLLTSVTACANSPTGSNLENILAADPRVQNNPVLGNSRDNQQPKAIAGQATVGSIAQLPDDFPTEIPRYPNAQLKEVTPTSLSGGEVANQENASQPKLTRWVTAAPTNLVQSFYQNAFQQNNWELSPTDAQSGKLEARLNDLQVTVSIQPVSAINTNTNTQSAEQNPEVATQFDIQYVRNAATSDEQQAAVPQPGDPDFIGPVPPLDVADQPEQTSEPKIANATAASQNFTDLNTAPQQVSQYIQDLAALGVLPLEPSNSKSNQPNKFEPSKIISRREYARWLVAANNAMYRNSSAKQIREASATEPAFQDVPRTDPDFAVIQGLAEAGLIPSSLSGDLTAVLFRPNAPLTREQMILWKVPIDTRQALPSASIDAVKETWGFQDIARIEPKALRAVLADFQNGDQSNIRRVFGYTTLFQPKKPVTRAEAATALWYFGISGEGISAQEALQIKNQPSQPSATSEASPSSFPDQ
ncbi:MAG: S-layer homology domain-containing protein [Gloeocapsa sp. UFS-A4-WI-NPMV-4B04]|nr:S-layer homology domain-containing protein [Gloeocapsa sp. UFS-A4-WI-NPMV-4B04]